MTLQNMGKEENFESLANTWQEQHHGQSNAVFL
jgi:hypothetical protein